MTILYIKIPLNKTLDIKYQQYLAREPCEPTLYIQRFKVCVSSNVTSSPKGDRSEYDLN